MKWFRNFRSRRGRRTLLLPLVVLLLGGAAARADLPDWIRNFDRSDPVRSSFFRAVPLPSGQIQVRRPPAEARRMLTLQAESSPSDARLYSLRALAAEQQLDFAAAEADWRKYTELAEDRFAAQLDLAEFYRRRLLPRKEIEILTKIAQAPAPATERLLPPSKQTSWRAFERILEIIENHAFPSDRAIKTYRNWIQRYPSESVLHHRLFDFLLKEKRWQETGGLIETYRQSFPHLRAFPVRSRASLAAAQGSVEQAVAVYEQSFEPLWPLDLVRSYFNLLRKERRLRGFLDRARAGVAEQPLSLTAGARLFYYYQQQGNMAAAQQALAELRLRKEAAGSEWTAEELLGLAKLYDKLHNYDEAARYYYALYSLPTADPKAKEAALGGIINLLLSAPEQPFRFGAGDFSFYKDVATIDPYPGFLNGILSLLLNSQDPAAEYARAERSSVAYFHRARAAQLLPRFDSEFPGSSRRPVLRLQLLQTYATYGDSEGVLREGRAFLETFADAPQRTQVALLMADAYARTGQVEKEFALYENLLGELARQSDNIPIGTGQPISVWDSRTGQAGRNRSAGRDNSARSQDYARVLTRYIARLVSLKRVMDALAVYQREIERNPDDAGLYEKLAAFLEGNNLSDQVEQVYRRALEKFPHRSWYQKLARWYLRRKQKVAFAQLTRQVVDLFSGTELEEYFGAVGTSGLGASLYLQLNLYAHERFPHNLTFVRNLLGAYRRKETSDLAAWEQLLRVHWFYDADLRNRFFAHLSRTKRLQREMESVRAANPIAAAQQWNLMADANPGAARFLAEGEAWQSHFDAAAPLLRGLAKTFPADIALGKRAAALHRSLVLFQPAYTEAAAEIEENLHRSVPRDRATLARIGEVFADRELFSRAKPYWERIAQLEPGKTDGYLEAATVFWDYYRFDDALRMLEKGRAQFSHPALFAYEAGAIYENRREVRRAVQEYAKGALTGTASSARSRLLQLSKRKALRDLVDEITARQVEGVNPPFAAVTLRTAVLEAQERRSELEDFLRRLARGATSLELLEQIDPIAQRHGFETVREQSLQRRIELTSDPVERMRLQLALARYYEDKRDVEAARRVIETLHRDHPLLQGVVRAAVDFYWRNKMAEPALQVLLQAADQAYSRLGKQFIFEAARKSNQAGQYDRARTLLAGLLTDDPFHSGYLAALADSYGREGNYQALRDFYLQRIEAVRETDWPTRTKREHISSFRRGLIPALTRLEEHAEAVDHYIELINRSPEEADLTTEAASYAARHGLEKRLLDYYRKTADASPRDFRWPMVLARIETRFEHFPEAIAAYKRSLTISPDRTDLLEAQARLEERLLRFDDAVRSNSQLYELAYHNPEWMERVAELHARRGRPDEAVAALRKALVEGRPEQAGNYFAVATRLERWNLLPQARTFVEAGFAQAEKEGSALGSGRSGLQLYARVMTRLRQHQSALQRLRAAGRKTQRRRNNSLLRAALEAMGESVRDYFTPEEKVSFVAFLEQQHESAGSEESAEALLPLARSAGLAELEASWLYDLLLAAPGRPETRGHYNRLIELQERRLRFDELAQQLEAYWRVYPNRNDKYVILDRAARSYRKAGNTDAEFRLLAVLFERGAHSLDRYFELLLKRDPERLVSIAGANRWKQTRNRAVEFALSSGDHSLAQRAVAARSGSLSPVWQRAYTGLAGLYYADKSAEVNDAFLAGLGVAPIGDRVAGPADRKQQLAGDIWFYYGSRYGEYLDVTGRENAEDYLASPLEDRPANTAAYLALAEYYTERGHVAAALGEYDHVLELNSLRAQAHDRAALLLWKQGRKTEATTRWKAALEAFERLMNRRSVEESFWPDLQTTLEHIGEHGLLLGLREDVDRILRTYVRRNGSYRVQPLLRGALAAAGDPAGGVAWIADLSREAPDPVAFLAELVSAKWIPDANREPVYERLLKAAEARVAGTQGRARDQARNTLGRWQVAWAGYLLATNQVGRAQAALGQLSDRVRQRWDRTIVPLEVRLAARAGTLTALLDGYRRERDKIPNLDYLKSAAAELRSEGRGAEARRVLEFVYTRELERQPLTASSFLGLAEIRLEEGALPDALALLRRLVLVVGGPFENQVAAAELLLKTQHPDEAAQFLQQRVQAAPWDADARLRLAEAKLPRQRKESLQVLSTLTNSSDIKYVTRVEAARTLGGGKGARIKTGVSELDWMAGGGSPQSPAVTGPHNYHARLQAAGETRDAVERIRLLLEARSMRPEDEAALYPLHRAAVEAQRFELAAASAEPLLKTGPFRYVWGRAEANPLRREQTVSYAKYFLTQNGLTKEQRTQAGRGLATTYEKLGRLALAELFLQIALELEPDANAHLALERRLDYVRAERERQAANAQRRPTVTENLSQPRAVRPRLPAPPETAQERGRP